MNFFELFDISERYLELLNPTSPEKVLEVGRVLGLNPDTRLIDFGCGYAEPLKLWGEAYGISGVGVDIREHVCDHARAKLARAGLADRIEIVCSPGADYDFPEHSYDVATCLGASFIWKGFQTAVQALARAVVPGGQVAIGEPYWLTSNVPPTYAQKQGFHSEAEILRIVREEGFDLEYLVRASLDDWDRYSSGNWYGLVRWLQDNPGHPERGDVIERLRTSQDEYFRFEREYVGWAIFILAPTRW